MDASREKMNNIFKVIPYPPSSHYCLKYINIVGALETYISRTHDNFKNLIYGNCPRTLSLKRY